MNNKYLILSRIGIMLSSLALFLMFVSLSIININMRGPYPSDAPGPTMVKAGILILLAGNNYRLFIEAFNNKRKIKRKKCENARRKK